MHTGARERVRAFDGVRGLAVAAVVLFHAQINGARGGFLGVSAFFTLSGYLITSLLLDEHRRTGGVSLRGFWSRRARRLLPAAYVALAGILLYGATVASGDQLRSLRGDVFSAIAYVANWRFYFSGRSYEQLFSAPSPVLHFWSLAIEEQFYLLFPLLLIGAVRVARGHRVRLGVLVCAGIAASLTASVVLLQAAGQSRVYYGTDTRASELLVGALLAVFLSGRATTTTLRPGARTAVTVAGFAALAAMITCWVTVAQTSEWLYRGGFTLHAVFTAVVIAAACVRGPFGRVLGLAPLVALGRLSYGIYLFHWPIFLWLSPERTGLSTAPLLALRLALTLALAIVSFHFLEQPVLSGVRVRGRMPRVVAPAVATALVTTCVLVTWSPPPSPIVLSALNSQVAVGDATVPHWVANANIESPPSRVTNASVSPPAPAPQLERLYRAFNEKRPLRVLVVGDSVGVTLGRGVELWARSHGDAVVLNKAHIYCPLGRDAPAIEGYLKANNMDSCDWTSTWQSAVNNFDPDVTILLFTVWEAAQRKVPGAADFAPPGTPAVDAWQLSEYGAAADLLTSRGGHVLWLNVPCAKSYDANRSDGLWYVNRKTIPTMAAARPLVHPVDADAHLCPDGKFRSDFDGVTNGRPDGAHFSDPGAVAFTNWLMPIVLGESPVPPYRAAP